MKSLLFRLGVLLSLGVFFSLTGYAQKSPQSLANTAQPTANTNVEPVIRIAGTAIEYSKLSKYYWACRWRFLYRYGGVTRTYRPRGPVYERTKALAKSKAIRACNKFRLNFVKARIRKMLRDVENYRRQHPNWKKNPTQKKKVEQAMKMIKLAPKELKDQMKCQYSRCDRPIRRR